MGKHSRIERSWIQHSWMRAVCVTICLMAAGPAGAQSPSPDTLAAARELIVTRRAADYFKTIMPAIVQQLKPAIVQNRPQVERDYDAIMPLMLESMNARVNEIVDQVAALYARNFTAAELNEVVGLLPRPDRAEVHPEAAADHPGEHGHRPALRTVDRRRAPLPHRRRVAQARPRYLRLVHLFTFTVLLRRGTADRVGRGTLHRRPIWCASASA